MKNTRSILTLFLALLILAIFTLPTAGCLETTVPATESDDGNVSPDLPGELQDRIQYVRSNREELAATIHGMINEERKKQGLDALQWDQTLANIAFSHSQDMAERDYFDHASPEGKDFSDRYEEHSYHLETRIGDSIYVGGENLALGNVVRSYTYDQETKEVFEYHYSDLDELAGSTVQGWMDSPGHRDNILTPFTREGIGICISDEGEIYITQNFS